MAAWEEAGERSGVKLLVVEDDPGLQQALCDLIRGWGYTCQAVERGADALALLGQDAFDLVLLDLGLPDLDGLEVARRLRRLGAGQPLLLMLTARDSSADRVQGLEDGADDYLVKPFDPAVLRAHIRALLRRCDRPLRRELSWGELRLTPGETRLWIGQRWLDLTRKEALLLEMLLRADGRSCSKAQLLEGSAAGPRQAGEETVKAHIRNLRSKLLAAGCQPHLIETVHGLGYRLNPDALT